MQYLIKAEEATMNFKAEEYLKEIPLPETPFSDSEHFKKEVQRIMEKLTSQQNTGKKVQKSKAFEITLVKNDNVTEQI